MRSGSLALIPKGLAWLFLIGFVALPILVMFGSTLFTQEGFTLSAWGSLLADENDQAKLLYSMQLGLTSTAIALLVGGGHAWLTTHTDLPGARFLGPLGVAPLVIPPILVAMGFADLDWIEASGFWLCALLLGVVYAPFVAVLVGRGLRSIDGRLYEAALLSRGRLRAEGLLFRMVLPEVLAGSLLAFVFVISEHGVPEFLTVKGKTWHTYAEGLLSLWNTRAVGTTAKDIAAPVVASLPLLVIITICIALVLRFRARASIPGDFRPLPSRQLGPLRFVGLALPAFYLLCGVVVPVVVMGLWAAGSTQVREPMSIETLQQSFRTAASLAGDDLTKTLRVGGAATVLLLLVAVPLARMARRRPWIDTLSVLPIAVPAILLSMGMVHIYNSRAAGATYDAVGFDLYDSWWMLACAYAARFLPFGVLTLSHNFRRVPSSLEEAALLSGRGTLARTWHVSLPLMRPAMWSAACLAFILALRELDVAVVLSAGNGTVVRRLSNIVHYGGEDMGGALALLLLLAATLIPLLTILLTGRKLTSLS